MDTVYTFGLFRLDMSAEMLFRGADPMPVGRRGVALMRALLEQPGIPVSKSALLQAGWPGLTVEESNLSVQIAALRRALGEEPGAASWIETVPRHGYRFVGPTLNGGPATGAGHLTASQLSPPHLSVVVLPFANLSGNPEQDYFVDGVTESLATDLSRISGSFVIASNTAFTFKGKAVDVKRIGRELNVRYVLEGSVQRADNRLRVNVQLIDAETGSHTWAERFDKPVANLFDMQDEIVSRLANALNAQLIDAEAHRAERSPHPDSMDLYFQGMAWLNKGLAPNNLAQARSFFERALALDPGNIEALVGIAAADAYIVAVHLLADDRAARLFAAEAALTKVLFLSPGHARAHYQLGFVQMFSKRAAQGIAECERALELDRNLACAHGSIGQGKYFIGRAEETEAQVQEALRISPIDTNAYQWIAMAGFAKLHLGRDAEAVVRLRRALELNRNFSSGQFYLAAALANLGRVEEARSVTQAGLTLDPSFTICRFRASATSDNLIYLAQRERIYEGMRKAGLPEG